MKNKIISAVVVTFLLGVCSLPTNATCSKPMTALNNGVIKEEADINKTKEISKNTLLNETKKDTVYANGEPLMISYSLSKGADKRLFSIHNLKNEMIAYIVKMNYLNGRTYYQVNFTQTKQSTYGSVYQTIDAFIEVIGDFVVEGKVSAAAVEELATSNKLVLKNNVVFTVPQNNLDDIQRSYYGGLNNGKATVETAKKQTPSIVSATASTKPAASKAVNASTANSTATEPVATAAIITLKNYSSTAHHLIFNRLSNNQVSSDKTSLNSGASNTYTLNMNDEIVLVDMKGKKIAAYTVKSGVKNLIISSDGKNIKPGKATVSNTDVAFAK